MFLGVGFILEANRGNPVYTSCFEIGFLLLTLSFAFSLVSLGEFKGILAEHIQLAISVAVPLIGKLPYYRLCDAKREGHRGLL